MASSVGCLIATWMASVYATPIRNELDGGATLQVQPNTHVPLDFPGSLSNSGLESSSTCREGVGGLK
jgi:hypothetical protein